MDEFEYAIRRKVIDELLDWLEQAKGHHQDVEDKLYSMIEAMDMIDEEGGCE